MVTVLGTSGFVDPLNSANYLLDCGDTVETLMIGFMSFTGPRLERGVIDYFPGGVNGAFVRKVPDGKVNSEPIDIEKGVVPFDQLSNLESWYKQVVDVDGNGFMSYNFRRPVRILVKDNSNIVQKVVTLRNAWPSAMKVLSDFSGDAPRVVSISLTVQYEGFKIGTLADAPSLT